MKFFELSITGLILRFYLLMAIVLVAGFTGYWLLGLLALPIFFSCMTGIRIGRSKEEAPVATALRMETVRTKKAHAA